MIESTILNVKAQILPKGIREIEILVIDGMSTDKTKEVSSELGARVFDNLKMDVVSAKYLGLINCIGNYVVFLDQDEYFVRNDSIKVLHKSLVMSNCIVAITSGYYQAEKYSAANYYASTFGDPVSLFYYNFPNDYRFRIQSLKSKRKIELENEDFIVFSEGEKRILVEIAVMGNMMDFNKTVNDFPQIIQDKFELAHLFSNLDKRGFSFCSLKSVPIGHKSADSLLKIIKKIKWRIKNNLSGTELSGIVRREGTKYALMLQFLLYVVLLVPMVTHTIYWTLKLRRVQVLINLILSFFIVVYYPLFIIKQKFNSRRQREPGFQRYGE